MLEWATAHPEADVVFRPHPFLFGTLRDEGLLTEKQVNRWRDAWDALPNTFSDKAHSFPELFLASDALLTDGVSFLAEYPLVTGRPSIFWEKPEHWSFTAMGQKAAAASVIVHTAAEVDAALQQAMTGDLPDRAAEIDSLIHAVSPNPGHAAETIVELVAKDFS
jgi:CDP-glycerol glycerophosphotransferase (TagB/SpsB family)